MIFLITIRLSYLKMFLTSNSLEFQNKDKTELENNKLLFSHLMNISESQATDERLWTGLCNPTFYEYVINKLDYDKLGFKDKNDSDKILSKIFYKGGIVAGKFRNTLAKC